MATEGARPRSPRERLEALVDRLEHVLPGQAPIRDFVHHNTLHGFEQQPFADALRNARTVTGIYGYLPPTRFRALYAEGRIARGDLEAELAAEPDLDPAGVLLETAHGAVVNRELYLALLLDPPRPITQAEFDWQVEEHNALHALGPELPAAARRRLLERSATEGLAGETDAVDALWHACRAVLGLEQVALHPEELVDLDRDQAEALLAQIRDDSDDLTGGEPLTHRLVRKEAERQREQLFARVGPQLTLSGLLEALTGHDLLAEIRPLLLPALAAWLDLGFTAWRRPDLDDGFYASWRRGAAGDLGWVFRGLAEWRDQIDALPDDPADAIVAELRLLGVAEAHWETYLERLALELPGWSGMVLWRTRRPDYRPARGRQIAMLDYLAVRLVLERIFAKRLCREQWNVDATLSTLRWYFRQARSEFYVRHALFNGRLPEYLMTLAQRQIQAALALGSGRVSGWQQLADMIWTWRQSPAADRPVGHSIYRHAWPLFRLAQQIGLSAGELRAFDRERLDRLFDTIAWFDPDRTGFIWLRAYERHYRDRIFSALLANDGRGRWRTRSTTPSAQVVFCMDDREEGIRRHLEALDATVETLGAAGFFNLPINWRGLDDEEVTPLCPVVVTPAHEIREAPCDAALGRRHGERRRLRLRARRLLHEGARRNPLVGLLVTLLAAPGALLTLAVKVAAPLAFGRITRRWLAAFEPPVATALTLTAEEQRPATPERPRLGFTDAEQAERIGGFLRTIGLTHGFGRLVVIMGHGSGSANNPHLAAYDCGACSGRHGGPNARAFAQIANRPEVRARLATNGITIDERTWFLGAEHNTCDEAIEWYDLERLPAAFAPDFAALRARLAEAARWSAHERCRRLASAPRNPTLEQAAAHIAGRAHDFSQARPELGHATNAVAIIGRRSLTRGAFLDRRAFLISYDPSQDPDGRIVEAILLAAGPVGAGISLEYYFSTVDNDRFGCGSKVTHNLTGQFAVMEGTTSDLRSGLPRQMIEIHEAMRLLVVVEATPELLTAIYQRQPPLQQLVGNGWIVLAAKHPERPEILLFRPGIGFERWQTALAAPPTVADSATWYQGHSGPLWPALLEPEAGDD